MRILIAAALAAVCPIAGASASETLAGPYAAEIVRVIDGDTVEARIRVWLGLVQTSLVRIRGIDAPEMRGSCPAAGRAARDHLARLLGTGPIRLSAVSHDKYGGRIDAALHLADGADVAAAMIGAGHARPWPRKGASPCPTP